MLLSLLPILTSSLSPRRHILTAIPTLPAVLTAPPASAAAPSGLATSNAYAAAPSGLATSNAYAVVADSTRHLQPSLKAVTVGRALASIGRPYARAVFLGEHHDAARDHQLQADIIASLRSSSPHRPLAVGFEMFQRRFQPVLDAYVAGDISEAELEEQSEWRTRWYWPFSRYLPVFRLCRSEGIEMLALNVDSEDLAMVESGGVRKLGSRLDEYVKDRAGFAAFSSTTAFKEYVAYTILPSYAQHKEMGILKSTITGQHLEQDMPLANFLAGRLLWDECMAHSAARWASANPGGLVVGLVGSDHVKFGCGVPARCARILAVVAGLL